MKFCIIMLMGLGLGCGGDKAPGATDSLCQASRPIIASRRDTTETLAQIRTNNRVLQRYCGKKKSG